MNKLEEMIGLDSLNKIREIGYCEQVLHILDGNCFFNITPERFDKLLFDRDIDYYCDFTGLIDDIKSVDLTGNDDSEALICILSNAEILDIAIINEIITRLEIDEHRLLLSVKEDSQLEDNVYRVILIITK